jgi:gamma-glutamylcysteine synthetase
MLKEMKEKNLSFFTFSMRQAEIHKKTFSEGGLSPETTELLKNTATTSIADQKEIEAADKVDFDAFLASWNDN